MHSNKVEVGCPCGGIRLHHLNRMFLGQPIRTPVDKLVLSVTTALGVYYSTGGADRSPTYGVQHGGHQHSQHAAPGDGSFQFAEESWSSSSDTRGEDEPVFSPVDEDDQVSAYKSKSRCNRKQLRFSQFRYTPTEPIVLQPPVFPHHGKTSHHPGKKGH
ncbi:hypothetical protein ATANTOWER_027507 [Ataeniobius toweri]|uniref:Uncharacterized protein n=1 Tax=Ataeniobius toweri TaxID=208326 RepID=A0ABU7CA70_9TELE|nr:hypothetical protein [Ataeniobius toweri]